MATVGTWKNSPFAVPLCSPIEVHNAGKPGLEVLETCLCLTPMDDGPEIPVTLDCPTCPDGIPLRWRVTANVQDNGCCFNTANCTQFSSWVIEYLDNNCSLSGPGAGQCCWSTSSFTQACGGGSSGTAQVFSLEQVDIDGTLYYILYTGSMSASAFCGPDIVRYRIPVDDFDCNGTNVLEKYFHLFTDQPCLWPDSVTMEPEP